jgi:hypothetical protein
MKCDDTHKALKFLYNETYKIKCCLKSIHWFIIIIHSTIINKKMKKPNPHFMDRKVVYKKGRR